MNRADVRARMARTLGAEAEEVTDEAVLRDLVAESFKLVEMVIDLQETFGLRITQDQLLGVHTVGDLLDRVVGRDA